MNSRICFFVSCLIGLVVTSWGIAESRTSVDTSDGEVVSLDDLGSQLRESITSFLKDAAPEKISRSDEGSHQEISAIRICNTRLTDE